MIYTKVETNFFDLGFPGSAFRFIPWFATAHDMEAFL